MVESEDDFMSDEAAYWDSVAELYDYQHPNDEFADLSFYQWLLRENSGPVLEIACGTGRIYLELLAEGHDIDGFDISADMLSILRTKATSRGLVPSVWQADMRKFASERQYGTIVIPTSGFLLNSTRKDQKQMLSSVYEALSDGGILALGFFNPPISAINENWGEEQSKEFSRHGEQYELKSTTTLIDKVNLLAQISRRVYRDSDELIYEEKFEMKLVTKPEFESLLELAGFSEWAVYGGYDRSSVDTDDSTQTLVWTVQK